MLSLLFSFNGRVGRTEWWLFRLGAMVVGVIVFAIVGGVLRASGQTIEADAPSGIAFAIWTYALIGAVLWIDLAISVKRWHDRGKSGFWILIGLVPLIGGLWALVECGFLPGTPELNKYDVGQEYIAEAFS